MLSEIKRYYGENWFAVAFDLDNGSAYISFYNANSEKFAEIYCDDYEHGRADLWKILDKGVSELPADIDETKCELASWENGRGNCKSPLDDAENWSDDEF